VRRERATAILDGRCARRHEEPQVGTKKRVPAELRNRQ
jgi:hypothetical protein